MTNITKRNLLFSLVILVVMQSCNLIKPVEIKDIEDVTVSSVNLKSAEVDFDLVIHNSNIFAVRIISADLSLLLNDKNAVQIDRDFDLKIPSDCDFTIPLNTTVYFKDLLSGSLSLLKGVIEDEGEISLSGEIVVKMLGIKKTIPVSMTEEIY